MSERSQEQNMRKLADLLARDLDSIYGEKESGPNGDKRRFLHIGRTFLRALSKDLGLRDAVIALNPGGIAGSGECTMMGMWGDCGIYVALSQYSWGNKALCYRSIRNMRDYSGSYNHFLTREDLRDASYERLCLVLSYLRKEDLRYERTA